MNRSFYLSLSRFTAAFIGYRKRQALGVEIDMDAVERYRVDYTFVEMPRHVYRYARANGEITYYGDDKQALHDIFPKDAQPVCEPDANMLPVEDDGSPTFTEIYEAVQEGRGHASHGEPIMSQLLAEHTREQIREVAPTAIAVLPTAAIEQHGPHMPILTDTLLCGSVALRAAEQVAAESGGTVNVLVAPVLPYGNSHHHRPFPGVLSLSSGTFMAAVTDILEGLVLSGFRKLIVLNGHGGNTDSNAVVGLDFVNRLDHDVAIATAADRDIARPAIVEQGIMPGNQIPGHAGRFEAAMVMALRPDLINDAGMAQISDQSKESQGLFSAMGGATVQVHGAWGAGVGYTDNPAAATAADGEAMLDIVVDRVAAFFAAFVGAGG